MIFDGYSILILSISKYSIRNLSKWKYNFRWIKLNVGSKGINYFLQSNEITLLNFPNKFLPRLQNGKLNIPQL